jgi:glycopeptide antibiotics resistance protein
LKDEYFTREIRNNIFLFIPFGMIISRVRPKWSSILNVLQVSVGIEILQFITGSGVYELDDIFSNMLGGTIGLTLGLLLSFGSDWLFTQIRGLIQN